MNKRHPNWPAFQAAKRYLTEQGFTYHGGSDVCHGYDKGPWRVDVHLMHMGIVLVHTDIQTAPGLVWSRQIRLHEYDQIVPLLEGATSELQKSLDELVAEHGRFDDVACDTHVPDWMFYRFGKKTVRICINGAVEEDTYWPGDANAPRIINMAAHIYDGDRSWECTPASMLHAVHHNLPKQYVIIQGRDSLETIVKRLAQHTLDPRFDDYGFYQHPINWLDGENAWLTPDAWTFHGNFLSVSAVFRIYTNHQPTIERLKAAVDANMLTDDYRQALAEYQGSAWYHGHKRRLGARRDDERPLPEVKPVAPGEQMSLFG